MFGYVVELLPRSVTRSVKLTIVLGLSVDRRFHSDIGLTLKRERKKAGRTQLDIMKSLQFNFVS